MENALLWIVFTVGFTAIMWMPYILNVIARMGLKALTFEPRPVLADWAQRAQRAHLNAVENLVIFLPIAVLYYVLTKDNTGCFAYLCMGYFVVRVIHYFAMLFKIPFVRTVAFAGGWVVQLWILWMLYEIACKATA